MCTQTFEIERVEVTALDHKQVKCYDIVSEPLPLGRVAS